ncbi:ATP-binding cassette domain-containing protein [Turicibacter sanguinis]|uniref:ABC transporter ATP-binding protein n=1 Tax=Turicibacter sanguinis TaxID=154288 RepID=UPI0012BD1F51|nr:ABC transporter ATP-binding protein [Turicibacter sanguinis]MDB8565906.1 ABC transporter ATP-binding protein [Turicibacter sanguinis]MDB8568658.1 ABC transporter ATP-binding protein [Turicibacter sanguinis]MDB8571407.1 ABC transporter ATP-binding protein [Turicibacter sanguinis]MDB8580166.1 ABC transporter ATP-binding protein [Turicibacter sanguinis]MTO10922.1 ATP-binding cassette domain-containing protein [Turicibacter sanguinis]
MGEIFKHLKKPEWGGMIVCLIFIVTQVWLDLKLPDYMSEITRLVQTEGSAMGDIWVQGSYMLFCALGSLISAVIVGFFAARIAATLSKRLRESLYTKVESFSMQEINQFSTASLITRSTNDITQVQMVFAMGLQVMIKAPILAVWAILKILGKNFEWSLVTAGAVCVLLVMLSIILIFAVPKFKIIQGLTDNLNLVTRENLTGIRVVRAYNAENYQEEKFENANNILTRTHLFTGRIMAIMGPGMTLIMSGLSLAIYWIGAYLIEAADRMDKIGLFSDMVVFSSYSIQVVMAFMMLTMIFIMLPRATVSAKRIMGVLNTPLSIVDGTKQAPTDRVGEVEFRNVSFKYPDAEEYVIENISFKANRGETVAFIGSTGSGKSTLINLVPRFYDATEGEVLVDGMNVKDYKQSDLNNKLGYVSQKAVLFAGTVESNIAFGDNGRQMAKLDQVKKAITIAQGRDFVEKMDRTYHSSIAQGGSNVSGGQKQRLAIARAICRDPEIYIFDDSFSALDYKTDCVLRAALRQETKDATHLIVAQRIGTIIHADKIIVLDEGKMVGIGTHQELLKNCEVYRQIAYSQLSKEELEHE